ncbi:MAG: dihydroorotase [Gammaproteobacteria bacterium]
MSPRRISFPRPDDWHVHLRDDAMLRAVVGDTARHFQRAIVMPNLTPPVTTAAAAAAYRERILAAAGGADFEPLMTCYLTDRTDADDLVAGARHGVFTAAKLYPAGATTNSDAGVTDVRRIDGALEAMSAAAVPLLVHGEVVDGAVDVFDREAVFIERVLDPLRQRHPGLRVVLEHITTADAVDYVRAGDPELLGATITPHHLSINRNAMFAGGMRPHMYCLPVAKRERHRQALVAAATSGDRRFFLGTDSAPHLRSAKESDCGCAGVYNSASALGVYLETFAAADALEQFAAFAAENGPRFYRLPVNAGRVSYERSDSPAAATSTCDADVVVFEPPFPVHWREVEE